MRYCAPLRHPSPLLAARRSEGRDPSRRWASRVAPCSVPTCHAPYPGERSRHHWSVTPARSDGLPRNSGRSALTTSLSRPARASHVLRPVGLQTHPWWTDVPRASTSRLPSLPSRSLLGRTDNSPRPDLHRQEHCTFSRRAELYKLWRGLYCVQFLELDPKRSRLLRVPDQLPEDQSIAGEVVAF